MEPHVERTHYNSSSRYLYTNLKSALRRFILGNGQHVINGYGKGSSTDHVLS